MSSINEIDSITPESSKPSEKVFIKHLHIGVFFDGTNNNMVQQLCYSSDKVNMSLFGLGKKNASISSLKEEKKRLENELEQLMSSTKDIDKRNEKIKVYEEAIGLIEDRIKVYKDKTNESEASRQTIYNLRAELHQLNLSYNAIACSSEYGESLTDNDLKLLANLKKKIDDKETEIEAASAKFEVTDQELMDYSTENGFSNIAVMYSLFDCEALTNVGKEEDKPSKSIKLYIEGSGANDMTRLTKMNVNGLGFGLGLTGVTALVSKGIKRVTEYVDSLSAEINDSTKIHLYVFGFSRGATCARLFTHVATRKPKEVLKIREHEFVDFLPDLVNESGRVKFLERIQNRVNITVDFLGIYDTVASIGLLKQKDGWSDPLGLPYKLAPNYKKNWHYKNVTQYGLFLCEDKSKLKHVCHIGALDEFRENFAFTNIGENVPNNAIEILMPGCHSDIGGGYMSGTDQEISLPFYVDKEFPKGSTTETRKTRTHVPLKSFTSKPNSQYLTTPGTVLELSDLDSAPIELKSLEFLGWINNWDEEKKKDKKERQTVSAAEHRSWLTKGSPLERWNFVNKVYFKRYVKRGWSDVALTMMIDQANRQIKGLFKPSLIYDFSKTISDKEILKLANEIRAKCSSLEEGARYWLVPDDSISSDLYRHLRLNYIHFTSSGSLFHLKNPFRNWEWTGIKDGSAGNFGNKPNFDMNGVLCRITYHGDKIKELENESDSDKEDNLHTVHVHYLYELESNNILSLN